MKEGFKLVEIFELSDVGPRVNGSPWLLTFAKGTAPQRGARVRQLDRIQRRA
jgi:hypothetical protein